MRRLDEFALPAGDANSWARRVWFTPPDKATQTRQADADRGPAEHEPRPCDQWSFGVGQDCSKTTAIGVCSEPWPSGLSANIAS